MKTINTKNIKLTDIPNSEDSIRKINEFALTYDWKENGDEVLQYDIESDFDTLEVSILRYILYCEQRRWNHFGKEYDSYTERRIRLLVKIIRKKMQDTKNVDKG